MESVVTGACVVEPVMQFEAEWVILNGAIMCLRKVETLTFTKR